ncbi:phosphoribosylformimino-5-aminoimidazole carboxamide ribotide isomerase [Methanohalophilus levihalophilus]|uniref:1-(5-phosphoribosyl)-5-[(5- phosphoribosylamino)methylideneamino]imidazole-4- carboxamide isomerase n=1 Tax=Methanohalophilus levihalophilus TaxID=1431282 RepID=UPI001AE9172F|nr:1-(5-phosphoribosyl)-5-[(5-phosphoribosylamino)methylideneamino]imidazole-4-carboxamide isomerase [Methanohalophilus levihalophilus]MBP2030934.1 phosphoribosylformimino-5-aminoimidazole carboxamide ribotide isomerase [Methanohalophilus levihalophilus]
MTFEVMPAVDMKNGKCVQLIQGQPDNERISLDDPIAVARDWIQQGAKTLHLIDLDGAIEGERKNKNLIEKIVALAREEGVSIQVGGGIRSYEDAAELLEIGVDRVILGTAAVENPELVARLAGDFGSEHINVALDSKEGKVSIKGWTELADQTAPELGRILEEKGAGSILFTNIDSEGLMEGINAQPTIDLVKSVNIPVIASGGVTTLEDIKELKKTGAIGVVVGSALYTDKFTLTEAINTISEED